MTRGPVVIDTNVVVAGVLTSQRDSPPAQILDGMLSRRFRYLLSAELLEEYRDALLRPRIQRRHRLSPAEVDVLLTDLAANALWVEIPAGSGRRNDEHLRELASSQPEALIVTGDIELAEGETGAAVTPRAFTKLLAK